MTGFGRAVAQSKTHKITVEVKSLNSKQLDLNVRIPYLLRDSEPAVRAAVGAAAERGKIDMTITCETLPGVASSTASEFNVDTIAAYKRRIEAVCGEVGIAVPGDLFRTILSLPESLKSPVAEADDDDARALNEALAGVIDGLMSHRRAEGEQLETFFRERVRAIGGLLTEIEPFEVERVPKIRARLEESLSKIPAVDYDKGRLEQELIFYIEKLDVNEEKQRLRRHLEYFEETLSLPTPGQGKKLGFISQEMGREINTLGSKSNDADMQRIVVRMKDLLEQIKEQVLNVM